MRLSYVIISYNRCEALRKTLSLLPDRTPLPRNEWDVWVVDNASTDGTAAMLTDCFPGVNRVMLPRNIGMPARNAAFERAKGRYFICLDDDSYPRSAQTVASVLHHMDGHADIAALVARVELPDGTPEGPAFPSVLLGGATCFRASALHEVGGFSPEFFRQAEEYELSCRIWVAGYRIERFEDVVFQHDKVAGAGRASSLVHRMDVRNNLIVAERFLPPSLRRIYREDWSLRYGALARHAGHASAAQLGRWQAKLCGWREAYRGRQILSRDALENVFHFRKQAKAVREWAASNALQTVCIADFSKNIFATMNACRQAGLSVRAVLDDNPAYRGLIYRGAPVLPLLAADDGPTDGIVLSNTNPSQIDRRMAAIADVFDGPVLRLWQPQYLQQNASTNLAAA